MVGLEGGPEVRSAHVYPRSYVISDNVRSKIALCQLQQLALDEGWIPLTGHHWVLVRNVVPTNADYASIREFDDRSIQ